MKAQKIFGWSLALASLGFLLIAIAETIRTHRPPQWLILTAAGLTAYGAFLLIRHRTPKAALHR